MIVEYVGRRQMRYRTLEAVRVIDTKFGRQRLAYFDRDSGLLQVEVERGRTTTYRQYRETQGVLTPFEIGGGYRWHTELNTGLTADLFDVPKEVSWEPESVRIVVFEHAPEPPGGPAALRLLVEDLDPGWNPETRGPWLGPLTSHLVDTYMKRKLHAAGVLAGTDPPEWRLTWRVEEYWSRAGRTRMAILRIAVHVQSLRDGTDWEGALLHRWPVPPGIDGERADSITYDVILKWSAGLGQLLDARTAAAAQPASTPSAGSSSGGEQITGPPSGQPP